MGLAIIGSAEKKKNRWKTFLGDRGFFRIRWLLKFLGPCSLEEIHLRLPPSFGVPDYLCFCTDREGPGVFVSRNYKSLNGLGICDETLIGQRKRSPTIVARGALMMEKINRFRMNLSFWQTISPFFLGVVFPREVGACRTACFAGLRRSD